MSLLAATACDSPSAADADRVERIVLTPGSVSMQAGATATFSALVLNSAGEAMRDRRVLWASENEAVATVSQSGVVIAVAPGIVKIAASSGGTSASAVVTVSRRPVSLVRVIPGSATISVGASVALQVEALDATATPVLGRPITWSSSNETIAVVSGDGVVRGVAPGAVTVTATVDGQAGTAVVSVAPQPVAAVVITPAADTILIGGRMAFGAAALDSNNVPLAGRIVLWSSSNPIVATVASDGEVFGLAVGSARIRATVEGVSAEAFVLVQPVPVARVVTSPNQLTLIPGQTSQLTVTLHDSAGNVLSGRSVSYTTSDAQIATVSSGGLVIAIAQGAAQIDVASEGRTASVAVTVNPTPIASIAITPNVASLRVAQTARLVAQALDARGSPLSNRSFTWSSTSPNVATVNQSGDVTAVAAGVTSITAASEGQVGTATITVANPSVASLVISPKPLSLLPAQQQQLTVQLLDSAGGVLSQAGRPVAWVSRDPAIATVNSSGQVTGVAAGNTRVIAATAGASASVSDSVDVTVSAPLASSLTLTPGAHAMRAGETRALRAVITSAGSVVRGRNVAWQSRAANVATVTPVAGWPDSAAVVGISLGMTYVIATDPGGLRDSALVSVTPLPVTAVVVTPASTSIAINATAQLSAAAKDSAGGTLAPTITWVSRTPNVASVSTGGLVTGVASGAAVIEARANGAGANGTDVVGTASVTVPAPVQAQVPVHSVTVTSPRSVIVPGDTMHLTVVVRDAKNNVLTGRPITFSSSNSARTVVDSAGVVTGVATKGGSDIIATSEGKSGKVQVNSSEAVASMNVSGPTNSAIDLVILPGGKKRYSVFLKDGSGSGVNNQTILVSTDKPSVLSLSKTIVTTNGKGEATVDVSAGAAVGIAVVTFTAVRAGAIPPAAAGSNSPAVRLPIVVP